MSVTISGSDNLVLQVVNATYSTQVSSTVKAFTNTGLTATITPKSATNKILVIVNHSGIFNPSGSSTVAIVKLLRNSTNISTIEGFAPYVSGANLSIGSFSANYLDSPATTSAVTYSTQFSNDTPAGTMYFQYANGATSYITLMEIAG